MSLFFCFLLRWGSFNRTRKELQANALSKFLPKGQGQGQGQGQKANSDNTLRYSLAQFELESLNRQLLFTAKRLKRMKALEPMTGFQGLKVIALDATEHYRSSKIHCEECLKFSTPTKEDPTKLSYVHKGVLAQIISSAVHPFLAFEPILPKDTKAKEEMKLMELDVPVPKGHEGELTVAKRLLDKLDNWYPKNFYDVISIDALYVNFPFIYEAKIIFGKELVIKVKDERTTIFKEIEALSKLTEPKEYKIDDKTTLKTWDIDDLHLSLGSKYTSIPLPLRGVKAIETTILPETGEIKTNTIRLITTMVGNDFFKVSTKTLVRMVHAEWRIENNGFKDLKDNWFFEHNFFHHPIATKAIVLTFLIVYNLFYAFVLRHLKTYRLYDLSFKQIIDELMFSFYSRKYRFSFAFSSGYRGSWKFKAMGGERAVVC